ncbi:unnamed protein product [Didymodactylos carnosus]|uniref:NHL repeat-containing protein n=1 Tax=Didymodactylos carnosus TaxID=1234261 RepID=A0A8S2X1Q4_9BILA|nr:unnamed protein product [Didymodactylos carnosus]
MEMGCDEWPSGCRWKWRRKWDKWRNNHLQRQLSGFDNGREWISLCLVAGGNGSGNRLDQLSYPQYVFVDRDHSVYVSDWGNDRVMKWVEGAKQGIVVAGDQGQGNGLTQLSNPWGVIVDQLGTVYVADRGNHRIMRWSRGATKGSVIVGGNGAGGQSNQLNVPIGLSFDRHGNLYVVDNGNRRVQKFNIETWLISTKTEALKFLESFSFIQETVRARCPNVAVTEKPSNPTIPSFSDTHCR